jgi:hypothetical protein
MLVDISNKSSFLYDLSNVDENKESHFNLLFKNTQKKYKKNKERNHTACVTK